MKVAIESKAAKMAELLNRFGGSLSHELAASLNSVADGVKRDVTGQLVSQYQLSREAATQAITAKEKKSGVKRWKKGKATHKKLQAEMTISGNPLPICKLDPSPSAPMGGKTAGGVTVTIKGRRRTFPRSFVAKMKSGHQGVFVRTLGRHIEEVFRTSVPQLAEHDVIVEPLAKNAEKRLVEKFDKSVKKLLK